MKFLLLCLLSVSCSTVPCPPEMKQPEGEMCELLMLPDFHGTGPVSAAVGVAQFVHELNQTSKLEETKLAAEKEKTPPHDSATNSMVKK